MLTYITSHWLLCSLSYVGLSILAFVIWYAYVMSTEGKDSNELSEVIIGLFMLPVLLPSIAIYWIFVGVGELKEFIYRLLKKR